MTDFKIHEEYGLRLIFTAQVMKRNSTKNVLLTKNFVRTTNHQLLFAKFLEEEALEICIRP